MSAPANPWAALLRPGPSQPADAAPLAARDGSKTRGLLDAIGKGKGPTTQELCKLSKLTVAQVWGLLKLVGTAARSSYGMARWYIVGPHVPETHRRAAELLRRAGWTVTPPKEGER